MKFIFISAVIFTLLCAIYLGYFFIHIFDRDIESIHKGKIITKIIKCWIFPIISLITIISVSIYTCSLFGFSMVPVVIFIFVFIIFAFWTYSLSSIIGPIICSLCALIICCFVLFSKVIVIDTNHTSISIDLYDSSVVNDDLNGIIINIPSSAKSEDSKNYHVIMQYLEKDIEDTNLTLPDSIDCAKFKLIDTQDNKLEISQREVVYCNLLYYHGFTNFDTINSVEEYATKYILYTNPDNIIYE